MKPSHLLFFGQASGTILVTCLTLSLMSASANAGRGNFKIDLPTYRQECGSCHTTPPPQLLSQASWQAVMGGLDKHFGVDASLEPKEHAEILKYLLSNAGKHSNSLQGKPLMRISETRWFMHEHTENMSRAIWKHPAVKSVANCVACHQAAEKGDYSEATLRLPKGVRQ